jgi:hypothetical protein
MSIGPNPVWRSRTRLAEPRPSRSALGTRLAASEIEILSASLIAALAYCSWPLGYLFNSSLARSALASELEARGQPFSWLFILLDCLTGLATVMVAWLAWPTNDAPNARLQRLTLVSYAAFGAATGVDALIPVGCGSSPLSRCGVDLSHLNLDDYLTGIAIFALFVAAVGAQVYAIRRRAPSTYFFAALVVTAIWAGCGLIFFSMHFSTRPAVPMQHLVLTLTSAVALLVPIVMIARPRDSKASS